MSLDIPGPARVAWHSNEDEPPEDWSGAIEFATLGAAVEAIVTGAPQTGHPWILCGERLFAPHEVEALWREDSV